MDINFTGYMLIERDGTETLLHESPFEVSPKLNDTMRVFYLDGVPKHVTFSKSSALYSRVSSVNVAQVRDLPEYEARFFTSEFSFNIPLEKLKKIAFISDEEFSQKIKDMTARLYDLEREKVAISSSILIGDK